MIEVSVGSIWNGQVAVRDRYIKECAKLKVGLRIHHDGEVMEIPADLLKASIRGKSSKPVKDKFSKKSHYLCYFWWRPKKPDAPAVPTTQSLFA